jgi:amidase
MDGSSGPPSPEVAAAVDDAARLLTGLGHRVTPTRLPLDGPQFIQDFLLLWASGAQQLVEATGRFFRRKPDSRVLEPFTLGMAEMAAKAGPAAIPPVVERLTAAARAYDGWFGRFDVILSPVLDTPAPSLGELAGTVPYDTLVARLIEYVGWTPLHNVAGAPAMSVPLAWSASGLPIGVQFAARAGDERTLFELAYELERAQPWAGRVPPVHA